MKQRRNPWVRGIAALSALLVFTAAGCGKTEEPASDVSGSESASAESTTGNEMTSSATEDNTMTTTTQDGIVNSFLMTLRDTLVVVPFSFFSALILSKEFHGRTVARAIFFLPVIVSTGVLATMDSNSVISMMMDRNTASAANSMQTAFSASGLITTLFSDSLPMEMVDFITTATSGIYDIIIKSGLQIIIFIGGLNTISPSLFESSNIEGATAWVNFWKITFPMCGPYILLNVVYTIIDSFTNLSNPLISQIRSDLMGLKNFGVASAAAWVYFVAIFAVLGIVFAVMQRRVFYHE